MNGSWAINVFHLAYVFFYPISTERGEGVEDLGVNGVERDIMRLWQLAFLQRRTFYTSRYYQVIFFLIVKYSLIFFLQIYKVSNLLRSTQEVICTNIKKYMEEFVHVAKGKKNENKSGDRFKKKRR